MTLDHGNGATEHQFSWFISSMLSTGGVKMVYCAKTRSGDSSEPVYVYASISISILPNPFLDLDAEAYST